MKTEELRKKLFTKIENELEEFKRKLMQSIPEEIIDRAYELTVKDEIVGQIKEMNLEDIELKALIKEKDLLSECYEDWINADGRLGEVIYYTMVDAVETIKENYQKEQKNKSRESR